SAEETIALLEPFAVKAPPETPQQWDGRRKANLVLEVLQGKISAEEVSTRYGLAGPDLEQWQALFLDGAMKALDPQRIEDKEAVRELHAKIGAQAMEIEALRSRHS